MLKEDTSLNNIAYFDNAATTFPKPEEVYVFMDKFYRECGVNVGRGQHKLAAKAAALVAEARKLLLELNHCPNKAVVFTPSATEALNIILQGLICKDNINIYLSPFEHNAVTRVVHHLSNTFKLNVYTLQFDKTVYTYDLDKIKYQFFDQKPDIVIISHASNVYGTIAPIEEICALSKPHGAVNVIDMCQTMGLIDTDLNNENIDYAVFAAHKTLYGALGVGGFICNNTTSLEPLLFGGTGLDSANQSMPDNIPERYEIGSPNISAIAGLSAALKWIQSVGIKHIYEKEQANRSRLISLLKEYDNVKIIIPKDGIGVISCIFERYGSDNIGQVLSDKDIAVRTGLHCAPNAHEFMGTYPAGTVRFSVSYFNTNDDFNKLRDALNYIYENA